MCKLRKTARIMRRYYCYLVEMYRHFGPNCTASHPVAITLNLTAQRAGRTLYWAHVLFPESTSQRFQCLINLKSSPLVPEPWRFQK